MRILKFNEQNNTDVDGIRQLCKDYLSYLIDDGFKIDVDYAFLSYDVDTKSYPISIKVTNGSSFTIDKDFKNIFIPFLIILNEEYKIKNLSNNITDSTCTYPILRILRLGKTVDLTLNQFDSDRIIEMISNITIYISTT